MLPLCPLAHWKASAALPGLSHQFPKGNLKHAATFRSKCKLVWKPKCWFLAGTEKWGVSLFENHCVFMGCCILDCDEKEEKGRRWCLLFFVICHFAGMHFCNKWKTSKSCQQVSLYKTTTSQLPLLHVVVLIYPQHHFAHTIWRRLFL